MLSSPNVHPSSPLRGFALVKGKLQVKNMTTNIFVSQIATNVGKERKNLLASDVRIIYIFCKVKIIFALFCEYFYMNE